MPEQNSPPKGYEVVPPPPRAPALNAGGPPAGYEVISAPKEAVARISSNPSLWERATTGLLDPAMEKLGLGTEFTTRALSGRTADEAREEAQRPETPFLNRFSLNAAPDTSSQVSGFTSPVGLATMALGGAGKIPGTIGAIARVAGAGAGAGFGVQGASQMGVKREGETEADVLQRNLGGSAQVAGGLAATIPGAKMAPGAARALEQARLGIGEDLTRAEVAKAKALNDAANAQHAEAMAKHQAKVIDITDENFAKGAEARAKAQAAKDQHIAKTANVAEENVARRAEYALAADDVANMNNARKLAHDTHNADLGRLTNEVTTHGERLADAQGLKNLADQVRQAEGAKFDEVAKATQGVPAQTQPLVEAVKHAENSILKGSPESIKIFKSIMESAGEGGEMPKVDGLSPEDMMARNPRMYEMLKQSGAFPEAGVSFRDLHGWYSELGQKMSTGNLPGDVYHALKYVQEQGIGSEMNRIASEAGVGEKLADARAGWRRYMQTFVDIRKAVSRGGSPVARATAALDPDYAVSPFKGPAGARGIKMLREYAGEYPLARQMADEASQAVRKTQQIKAMGKAAPLKIETIPPPPANKSFPAPPPPAPMYEGKPIPPEPTAPTPVTVDPRVLKAEAIERIARGSSATGRWGVGHGVGSGLLYLLHHPAIAAGFALEPILQRYALRVPAVARWAATPTAAEIKMAAPPPRP